MNFDRLTDFLEWLVEWRIPGVDIMVDKDGETVYRHQAGYKNREKGIKMQGDELYQIYSATKVVTCAAALTLYEKGAYLLSDPVSNFIPEYAHLTVDHVNKNGIVVNEPARNVMTIRDLFCMTSGFTYDMNTEAIRDLIARTDGRTPTLELAKTLAKQPLAFEPGTYWRYSLSHDVLAAVVEVIAGMPFRDYVKKAIFDPCGMTESSFRFTPEQEPRLASQYMFNKEKGVYENIGQGNYCVLGTEHDSGGAGMVTSVEDYMRFARMMTRKGLADSGERVLSPGTVDLMRTNHLHGQQLESFDWARFQGYGYGLGVRTMMDRSITGSTGPVGEFGWGGAAGAYVLLDPENGVTAYYAQQMRNNHEDFIHPRLRNLIYACLEL
ncbi:MAG: beta-lactamase family protein [Clostridia bacterium]|nr:beta-lactamase family protein [Clostridia bacterium]